MKVVLKILDPANLLCGQEVHSGDSSEILDEIETKLDELGPHWTLEIEVIES